MVTSRKGKWWLRDQRQENNFSQYTFPFESFEFRTICKCYFFQKVSLNLRIHNGNWNRGNGDLRQNISEIGHSRREKKKIIIKFLSNSRIPCDDSQSEVNIPRDHQMSSILIPFSFFRSQFLTNLDNKKGVSR